MESNLTKYTIWVGFLFCSLPLLSQKSFDLQLSKTNFEAGSRTMSGYQTTLDFNSEDVKKGWWKYARSFGQTTDMRTHYEVVIPAGSTDGNVPITIYTVTEKTEKRAVMKMGVKEEKYLDQIEELLRDFKRDFYLKYYLNILKQKEVEAANISSKYQGAKGKKKKSQLLDQLNSKNREIDEVKGWIKGVGV